tara:strand:+ start:523 stop:933 length:411 start_codon:yes stop_codon:yes gene_type:complete
MLQLSRARQVPEEAAGHRRQVPRVHAAFPSSSGETVHLAEAGTRMGGHRLLLGPGLLRDLLSGARTHSPTQQRCTTRLTDDCAWRVQLSGFAALDGPLADACLKILSGVLVLLHSMMVIMYVLTERYDTRDGSSLW